MSFFGNTNQWGGLLKQAISNVETTFDTLLEPPEPVNHNNSQQDDETETYMDPISGMVTTVPKKKKTKAADASASAKATPSSSRPSTPSTPSTLQRQQSDLSSRLAAVMNTDKKTPRSSISSSRPASTHSNQSTTDNTIPQTNATTHSEETTEQPPIDFSSDDNNGSNNNQSEIESRSFSSVASSAQETDIRASTLSTSNKSVQPGNDLLPSPTSVLSSPLPASSPLSPPSPATLTLIAANEDPLSNSEPAQSVETKETSVVSKETKTVSPTSPAKEENADQPAMIESADQKETTSVKEGEEDEEDEQEKVSMEKETSKSIAQATNAIEVHKKDHIDDNNDKNINSNSNGDLVSADKDDGGNDNDGTVFRDTTATVDILQSTTISDHVPADDTATEGSTDEATSKASAVSNGHSDKDRILAQREQQLLQAMETIAKLHDQIHGLQQNSEETTAHIRSLEDKLKDQSAAAPASSKNIKKYELSIKELNKQIAAKEEKIHGLLQEGEKLSKNELKQATTIKRLRAEKQDHDKIVTDLQKKLDKATADVNDLTTKSKRFTETEKRAQESVKMLTEMTERQTKHINKLETDSLQLKEQYQQSQAELASTLENLDKERNKAKIESEQVHAAALEKEVAANGRLHKELTATKKAAESTEAKLRNEIRELQIALQTLELQAGQREDNLRREVADLQRQVQERGAYVDDVASSVEEATAPLMRQIEELQTQHSFVIKNRDQTEERLLARLQQAEKEHLQLTEELKAIKTELQELKDKYTLQTKEMDDMQQGKDRMAAKLESTSLQIKTLEDQLTEQRESLERQKEKEAKAVDDIKRQYQKLMRERLQEEKKQWEARHQEQLQQPQRQQNEALQRANVRKSFSSSSTSPSGTAVLSSRREDDLSPTFKRLESQSPPTSSRSSVDSAYTGVGSHASHVPPTVAVDRLQATIRHMENQLNFYQTQLQSAAQSRDEISEELMAMTVEMDKLRNECKKMHELETEHNDLNRRYHASLELLGERTEQVQELRADIDDVKEMYRSQIVEMVQKIDQLSKSQAS